MNERVKKIWHDKHETCKSRVQGGDVEEVVVFSQPALVEMVEKV